MHSMLQDDHTTPLQTEDYTVGWISALAIEHAAATAMLDEDHGLPQNFKYEANDNTIYTFGRIGDQNVVLACLNAGQYGTNSAASIATQLIGKFTSLRFGLMVGIAGGVPSKNHDIRLGDVVVSIPAGLSPGVVQYDLGKMLQDKKFQRTGSLAPPPALLLNAVNHLRSLEYLGKRPMYSFLSVFDLLPRLPFDKPGIETDVLYDGETPIMRQPRDSTDPHCHYGTVASGNSVIKDSAIRDRLSEELGGVICFEMEAAGVMHAFPCLVIRGITDYADKHKNSQWQAYAAATAAAYAKSLLCVIPPSAVQGLETVGSGQEKPEQSLRDAKKLEQPEDVVDLPSGSRRGHRRMEVRGVIDEPGKSEEIACINRHRCNAAEKESISKTPREDLPVFRSLSETMVSAPKQPPLSRATFALFNRTFHVYGHVYSGNGNNIKTVVNNQGASISNAGVLNFGSVAGSIQFNNTPRRRGFATRAFGLNKNELGLGLLNKFTNWNRQAVRRLGRLMR